MNIVIWLLAGSMAGWLALSYLQFNEARGPLVAVIIGAVGAFLGGHELAPAMLAAPADPAAFSVGALAVAVIASATGIVASNLVHERFGV